jgi:Bacterial regulatory proteins, tetR family
LQKKPNRCYNEASISKGTENVAYATQEEKVMHTSEAIEDLRVRRTRKLLQQAFIECTIEKGFAALTVRDITERAMVNRSTFYHHYLDKYDLLEQSINEMLALLEDQEVRTNLSTFCHLIVHTKSVHVPPSCVPVPKQSLVREKGVLVPPTSFDLTFILQSKYYQDIVHADCQNMAKIAHVCSKYTFLTGVVEG